MGSSYLIEKMEHGILSLMFPREACPSPNHKLNINSKHSFGDNLFPEKNINLYESKNELIMAAFLCSTI